MFCLCSCAIISTFHSYDYISIFYTFGLSYAACGIGPLFFWYQTIHHFFDHWSGYPLYSPLRSLSSDSIISTISSWFNILGWPSSIGTILSIRPDKLSYDVQIADRQFLWPRRLLRPASTQTTVIQTAISHN